MWYDNERIPEEEGVSKLLIGKTFAYFPKCVTEHNEKKDASVSYKLEESSRSENSSHHSSNNLILNINRESISSRKDTNNNGIYGKGLRDLKSNDFIENIDNIIFENKEYSLIPQRLGRTIIPLNPKLLAQSTFDNENIDEYLSEIHKDVHKYSILTEYSFLLNEIPQGFYCLPQSDDLFTWDAFILLYSTMYKNGKFRIQIKLSENHPHTAPEVYFLTPIYHPLVNPKNGKLNLGPELNNWSATRHYISLIFLYIKNIFYLTDVYNDDIIQNEEAYYLLNNDKEAFHKNVEKCVQQSNDLLYNKIDNFMFNFTNNIENKKILNKLEDIKQDQLCVKKAEAFIHWFVNDFYDSSTTDGYDSGNPSIRYASSQESADKSGISSMSIDKEGSNDNDPSTESNNGNDTIKEISKF
ncbi:ubiquitin-conjugating enzyme E2, putative [Plasmodium vinckei brucechwatti]|uniref:Ubiquitin-conjugating enzyme E2, putative n=1 Tax=Plasmodium vinckei brucechwatti TaxID=119398 RepID=A0A6V7T254_PLAVN|nr:ubiquitin-conjugating enzyme E2, putative [Plasmodium vinckei brucechwatti]